MNTKKIVARMTEKEKNIIDCFQSVQFESIVRYTLQEKIVDLKNSIAIMENKKKEFDYPRFIKSMEKEIYLIENFIELLEN